jgi:hypothetical protein
VVHRAPGNLSSGQPGHQTHPDNHKIFFPMKSCASFVFALICTLVVFQATATVYRVNNIPGVDADYSTVASAISAASADDTLYIEGSYVSYGTVTLNKRLVLIGSGYFITSNDSTQAYPNSSRLDRLIISSTAAGSYITGIHVENTSSNSTTNPYSMVDVQASNVSIVRCYFYQSASGTSGNFSGSTLSIASNVNNVVVTQSFIYQGRVTAGTTGCYSVYALQIGSNCSGIVLANNIIKLGSKGSVYDNACTQRAFSMAATSSANLVNNVFMGRLEVYNSVFMNNIQIIGSATPSASFQQSSSYPNVVQNNIGNSTQFGTANGNQSNVNMTNIFAYTPGDE